MREAGITTTDGDRGEELKRSSERREGGVLQMVQQAKENGQNHSESQFGLVVQTLKSRFSSVTTDVTLGQSVSNSREDRWSDCVLKCWHGQ